MVVMGSALALGCGGESQSRSACHVAQFGVYVRCISSPAADPSEPILCGCAPIVLK